MLFNFDVETLNALFVLAAHRSNCKISLMANPALQSDSPAPVLRSAYNVGAELVSTFSVMPSVRTATAFVAPFPDRSYTYTEKHDTFRRIFFLALLWFIRQRSSLHHHSICDVQCGISSQIQCILIGRHGYTSPSGPKPLKKISCNGDTLFCH